MAQYYGTSIPEDRVRSFESELFQRAMEEEGGEVMRHDEFIVLCKSISDLVVFVICDLKVNELLIGEFLEAFSSALSLIYKKKVNAESLVKQIDLLYLLLDESIEHGFLFECDPDILAARTMLKNDDAFQGKAIRVTSV